MKTTIAVKYFIFSLVIALGVFTVSCSGKGGDDAEKPDSEIEESFEEFQMIDLSDWGIDAYIKLPDETANIGASTKPDILHPEDHLWQIDVGPNFTLHVEDMANRLDNIREQKRELARKKFFKVKYLIDDPDLIMYERELIVKGSNEASSTVGKEHKSYHVFGQKTIDGITYVLESREEGYERIVIELMAKSIKSLEPKEAK